MFFRATVNHDDRAIAVHELRAMVADPQSHCEAERVAEPGRCLDDIRIRQLRHDRRGRNGAIRDLPAHAFGLPTRTSCSTQEFPSGSLKSANEL